MPTVRAAREADRAGLHKLFSDSWMTVWAPHCRPASVERFLREDPVAEDLAAFLGAMTVAVADERLLGVASLFGDHLGALHVDPAHTGRGVGSLLMDHVEAAGAARLEVRAFNVRAIRFYERRGWRCARAYEGSELGSPMTTFEYRRSGVVSASSR